MKATQFAATALGLLPYAPPRGHCRDPWCWLCGGETGGVGWRQTDAIAPTFTQHNMAQRGDCGAVCQACASLTRAESFQALVARKQLSIKTWKQCGWHSYSHFIREDGHYEAPTPSRMREILLNPPVGRWLLTLNTTGKKHTIFRASVASSAVWFPLQVDEETIWTGVEEFVGCLGAFERLTALGCGKDGVQTGRYHPADTMRAGLGNWLPAERVMAEWRDRRPALVALVRIVAQSASLHGSSGRARVSGIMQHVLPQTQEPLL